MSQQVLRIRRSTLGVLIAIPVIALVTVTALGQDRGQQSRASGLEYKIVSPAGFRSVENAERFLNQEGREGWVFPDGTSIQKDTDGSFRLISPGDGRPRSLILRRKK